MLAGCSACQMSNVEGIDHVHFVRVRHPNRAWGATVSKDGSKIESKSMKEGKEGCGPYYE